MDPETEPGIAAIEREQITKPRPMELDGPPLHQPVKMEQTLSYEFVIVLVYEIKYTHRYKYLIICIFTIC